MFASGDRREDKRNIEDENYNAGLGQKNVAVEAVAHRSVQEFLLQKVCGRTSSGCQTNEISCSGWPQECPLVPWKPAGRL